jgi:hypothetical protein
MMSQRGDAVSGGSSGGGVSWYAWRYAGDAPGLVVDLGRFGAVRNSHRCSLGVSMFDACASQPPPQRPATFAYNCDSIGVLQDMTWMSRDSDGARGTGTDSALECQPNCAQGTRLFDPIVVHAWNPLAPTSSACPPYVRFYSDMTIAYSKGLPPWINPGTSGSPGTDFVTVDGMPAVHFSGLTPTCAPL